MLAQAGPALCLTVKSVKEEQKLLIQRAADLEGRSMTDFVLHSAEAAAERYFGVGAAQLNVEQAARLAAMAPNPRFYERNQGAPGLAQLPASGIVVSEPDPVWIVQAVQLGRLASGGDESSTKPGRHGRGFPKAAGTLGEN